MRQAHTTTTTCACHTLPTHILHLLPAHAFDLFRSAIPAFRLHTTATVSIPLHSLPFTYHSTTAYHASPGTALLPAEHVHTRSPLHCTCASSLSPTFLVHTCLLGFTFHLQFYLPEVSRTHATAAVDLLSSLPATTCLRSLLPVLHTCRRPAACHCAGFPTWTCGFQFSFSPYHHRTLGSRLPYTTILPATAFYAVAWSFSTYRTHTRAVHLPGVLCTPFPFCLFCVLRFTSHWFWMRTPPAVPLPPLFGSFYPIPHTYATFFVHSHFCAPIPHTTHFVLHTHTHDSVPVCLFPVSSVHYHLPHHTPTTYLFVKLGR